MIKVLHIQAHLYLQQYYHPLSLYLASPLLPWRWLLPPRHYRWYCPLLIIISSRTQYSTIQLRRGCDCLPDSTHRHRHQRPDRRPSIYRGWFSSVRQLLLLLMRYLISPTQSASHCDRCPCSLDGDNKKRWANDMAGVTSWARVKWKGVVVVVVVVIGPRRLLLILSDFYSSQSSDNAWHRCCY